MSNKFKDYEVNSKRWLSLEDFDGEIWKDVPGLESFYQASNYGRIKTASRKVQYKNKNGKVINSTIKEKIRKVVDNGHGYLWLEFWKDNIHHHEYVHRIIAKTFIPNPMNLPQVNHRDEDKYNNSVSNLEWCSQNYNNKYGTARFRLEKARRDNGNTRHIDMYSLDGTLLKHYDCAYDIEKDGLSRREVYNVCYHRTRSYKNCVFRFSEEPFSYRDKDSLKKGLKKQVFVKDKFGNILKIYDSIKAAEKDNNLSRNYLYSATYASTRPANIKGLFFEIQTIY